MKGVDQVVQSARRLFSVSTKGELIVSLFDESLEPPSEGAGGKGLFRSQDFDFLYEGITSGLRVPTATTGENNRRASSSATPTIGINERKSYCTEIHRQ